MTLQSKIFSGVSQELSSQYNEKFSPAGQANQKEERQARKLRASQRESQLADLDQQNSLREDKGNVAAQEIEILRQENNSIMAGNAQQTSFNAFDRFTGDYDVRHLNTMLTDIKKNPKGKDLFGGILRVDKLTQADNELLQRMGLDPEYVFANPQLANGIVVATRADGTKTIEDMGEIFKMTGYTRYASQRERTRQREVAEIQAMKRDYGYSTATERQAHRVAISKGTEFGTDEYQQAYNTAYTALTARDSTGGTKDEREAARVVEDEGFATGTPEYDARYNEVYQGIVARDRQTSRSRDLDETEQAKVTINERVDQTEGVDSFFDVDFGKRENRLKYEDEIRRIERLGASEMSTQDKKDISYIKQLIAVGNQGADLGEAETGFIDRFSRGIKNYVTDNVEGTDATSAYAAYRNIIRNALYGSALTASEIKAFNQQFGNLGQQAGPVLQQFRTAMMQVKAKLESLYATNDSYVTHFRMGVDQEELGQIVDALDERIEFFRRAEGGIPEPTAEELANQDEPAQDEVLLSDEERAELDGIFNPGGGQ